MKITAGLTLAFIKLAFFPNSQLLMWMGIAIVLDFITGVAKAVINKEARTSSGYRKTLVKFLQYGTSIAVGVILQNAAKQNNWSGADLLSWFNDGLLVFIIYIEVTSIFENAYACDKNSLMSQYLFQPALKLLTFQLKNNPVIQAANNTDKS
jgi:phage-related holin